jgi:hypothetical protein
MNDKIPQQSTKEERKMRKLVITFTIAMLLIPTIASAQEDQAKTILKAFHAKLSPSITSQDTPAAATTAWGILYVYQASGNGWWTGLAIMNGTTPNNQITVGLFDVNGTLTGQGTISVGPTTAQRVDMLSDMISSGYVPPRGSVFITGTSSFSTAMFVGNGGSGFSMMEKLSTSYSY